MYKSSQNQPRHIVDLLFLLALFCVFAFSALMLVMLGSDIYQTTVQNMSKNYNSRTAFSYITEKIKQQDQSGSIAITTFGDGDALALYQNIGTSDAEEQSYVTYLYLDQGNIKELFTTADNTLSPSAGQSILECTTFQAKLISPGLYHVFLQTADGEEASLYINAKSDS